MDVEEQLDLFFIRREDDLLSSRTCKTNSNLKNHFKKDCGFSYIPLTVQTIKNLKEESWNVDSSAIEIFSGRVRFRNCLVYGKIMGRINDSKTRYNYLLDDGTGCLSISIPQRVEDMQNIWKLENELEAIKKQICAQNKKEIVHSLRNLLFQTKKQIDHSNITNGSKVILYGRPSIFHGQISLNVFCLASDNNISRDIEIAFKDYLIEWHRTNASSL